MCMFCIWVYTLVDTPQYHKLCNGLGRVVTYGLPSLSSTIPGGNFVPSGSVFDPLDPAVALMLKAVLSSLLFLSSSYYPN